MLTPSRIRSLAVIRFLTLGLPEPAAGAASAAAPRPNITVIFTDDQGYQDLGCFGSRTTKTPHLARMAAGGLMLNSFYARPVCGFSRAAPMTGSYPIRVGEPGNRKRLHAVSNPLERTMPEGFQEPRAWSSSAPTGEATHVAPGFADAVAVRPDRKMPLKTAAK
jgi:arylsulfatase